LRYFEIAWRKERWVDLGS